MKIFELFIALLLGAICGSSSASNVSSSSNVSQNGCPPELNACLALVKAHEICSSLNDICTAIENGNATHQIRAFEANRCNGSEVFCPLTRGCLPLNSTCNVDTVASLHRRNLTPWGANCSAGQEFCSVSMSCIPVNTTCSLKAIYDWKLNGNTTYGPYGQVCSAGQTFCLATMSCIASVNASCEVPYNASAVGKACKDNKQLCNKTGGCIAMNSTCNPFPSVNMTARPDPGRGWKQLCQVRQSVCTRSLVGLARCFPKVSHCEQGMNHTKSPNAPSPNATSPNATSPSTTPPACGANQTFCEGAGRCMFSNETCCPRDHYECHSQGRCIPFHEPCPYEGPSDPCPPDADPCKETLSKSSILCGSRFSVCDALVNGNASTFSQAVSAVNQMACHGNGTYCPLTGLCTPVGASCTLDSVSSNNNSAPGNNSGAPANNSSAPSDRKRNSPWGISCPGGKSFCGLTMRCEDVCSVRKIYEWIINGNKTYGPNGHVCNVGTKFCFASMSCISANATCQYNLMTPHGNAGNVSVNASSNRNNSHIDDLCKKHDDFCLNRLKCVPGGSDCNVFPNFNLTGVNDTGTGWMKACKISNPLCQRKKYGVDKCFNVLGKCLITRNVTKYRCFAPRFTYCEHTRSCINASDHCCPPRETFCPERNRCIRMEEKCKMDACKDTPCGKIFQNVETCGMLHEVCPIIINAPRNLTKHLNRKNNGTIPHCKPGEKFCYLSGQCQSETCGLNLDENGMSSQSPWGEACPVGKSFCRFTMSCIPSSKNCTMRVLQAWMKAGNTSVSPDGMVCAPGQKFCLASYSCISNMDNCTIPIPLYMNATQNVSTSDIFCGPYHQFCPKQFMCVRMGDPCGDPPAMNFTGASDNGTGFLLPCLLRKVYCPRVLYGGFKCGASRNFSRCLKRELEPCRQGSYFCDLRRRCIPNGSPCTQCDIGQTFCSKTSKCIRSSDYCLAPGECPPYQTDCPLLGGCINNTIPCLPPQSKIVYKTVWFFEQLQTVTPSLFPSGNTIAITSISNTNGWLVYHDGSSWVPASGISPTTALVLGKTSRIDFLPRDSTYHGVVLLNYTVISGTVGTKVDASSSARAADDVIVIVLLPYHIPPVMDRKDVPCTVKEDSRSNIIALEDLLNITIRNVSFEKNIPDEILPFLKRPTAEFYLGSLAFARTNRYSIAAVNLENDPRKGSFKGEPPVSRVSPVIKDIKGRFNFVPTLNYHGPFNASFAGVNLVRHSNDVPIRSLQMSPHVSLIIDILLYDKNASKTVIDAYNSVLRDLDSKNSAPSKANVISSVDALIAKGSNVKGLNSVKTLFTQAFQYAAAETSGVEAPPGRYPATIVTLPSGGRFFVQYSDKIINLGCKVIPINDAPVLTSFITFFPPIPYNLSITPYNGFNVSEITTRIPIPYGSTPPKFSKPKPFIMDVDGGVPGIAIVYAKNSSLGAYYYKTPGSSWQLIDLNNTLVNGKPHDKGEVLLLKPKSSLKFQMHDPNALWSNTEGRKTANLLLAAWDQSDNQTDGVHDFFFPTDNNASISKKYASAFTARYGCDNKPGSRGRIDACGRCGGNGVWCRGCDGVAFSGARIDHCGNCTGGTTNKTFNFRKDCGGGCGTSFRDNCGVCQKYGKIRNFTDCSGTCFGGAKINRCGYCVRGSTGKPATFGEDLCGICGGSNTTCLDCANVPRGTKVIDICGNCLEPTDSRFNGQCVRLGKLSPISGRHNSPIRVTVVGAGLQSYSTATCQFVNESGSIQNLARADIRNKRFVISTVNITVGTHRLRCQLDSLSTDYYTLNNFTFYDSSTISYSSITPNEIEANTGPINATIAGSGFPDTGYVRCISNTKFSSPAVYIDSSTVKCLFPNLPKSENLKVAVSFGEGDNTVDPTAPTFEFYATSPYPTAISFSQNLQALIVTMNKPTAHRGFSCDGLFSAASVSSFGSRAKCRLRTPLKMFVSLLGRPTIAPSESVTFNNGSLDAKFENAVKNASGTLSLVVQGPPSAIVPTARLSGPNKVGACARVRLDASASSGAGGRRLNFTWNVGWAADQDTGAITANATADLNSIQTTLDNLPAFSPRLRFDRSNLVLGFKYEFKVKVANFLGEESTNASLTVERENKQLPILAAGRAKRKVKASRGIKIQARALLSPCLDPNSVASNVLFNWEIDAVGVDLAVTNKPRLTIKKGTLEGGRQYTLTVTASMASDQTLSTTKNIVLDVKSGPLVPKIKGGSYRVVGATSTLTLDGRRSFDPDGSSDSVWYKWECADSSGDPCFVPDPSNAGRKIRYVLPTTSKISIDVGAKLEANNRYTFTMSYNKGSREASKSVVIKVEPGSPPDVEIRPQVNNKENPSSIVIIKAIAKSTMPTNNATWECVDEDGFGYVDLAGSGVALTPLNFNFQKKTGRSKVSKNFALVIAANTLANGVSYKFRVNVAHADSSAAGETIITTNAAPSQGILDISPSNGTAMDTLYKLSASEGWSDDPDDLPLKYQFGYFKKGSSGKQILLGLFGESSEVEDIKFPPGDESNSNSLTVFVDCKDALGAVTRQTATITVMPKVIDTAFLASAQDDILKSFESADWNSAIGNMGALLSSLPPGSSDPNQTSAVTEMKEAFASSTLGILQDGGVADDPAAKTVMYESMGSITDGGSAMSDSTKKNIKDTILGIETGASSSKRRRRRDVGDSSSIEVFTVSQAETTISLVSNLIDPNLYDSSTMASKTSLLSLAASSSIKVCAGLALGMSAAIVKDNLLVLRIEKNSLATADTEYVDMACNDCPSSLHKSARIKLGATLQTTYSSWSCASETTCSGVCLVTSQHIHDLLSSAFNNKTLTHVVDLKIYNPETYAAISISTLANPVSYLLPVLENTTLSNETYFQCHRWDFGTSSWTASGCVTNPTVVEGANGTKYINCSCTEVSYLVAFQVDSLPTTPPITTAPSTAAPPTPTNPPIVTRRARFALVGDYDTLVTPAKEAQFKADVRKSIATVMKVNESNIVNITLSKGSIIVLFAYIPGPTDTDVSMDAAVSSLRAAVTNGNFSVALSDGTVLKADPASFSSTKDDTKPTVPAPEAASTESGLTETEIIIIAAVCGSLAVIILVVVVVVCYRKKNKEAKVSPESSRAQLRGNDVEMADREKRDGNHNEAVET